MSRSRCRRSRSPANPHHAGVAYRKNAMVLALATRWSSCIWRPWVQRSLNANMCSKLWNVICHGFALSRTPRTPSVVTLTAPSMKGCKDGCMDLDLARVTTSSFVLDGFSCCYFLLISWCYRIHRSHSNFLMLSYSFLCSLNPPTGKCCLQILSWRLACAWGGGQRLLPHMTTGLTQSWMIDALILTEMISLQPGWSVPFPWSNPSASCWGSQVVQAEGTSGKGRGVLLGLCEVGRYDDQ